MFSCCNQSKPTHEVTLAFKREEILYDVKNYCYIEGDIVPEGEEHSRHQIHDVGESGNVDRVTRLLNLIHTECVEMLYPYSKTEISRDTYDNDFEEPEEYIITLVLPDGFSQTTIDLINKLIHEYFVSKVIADWMSITKPTSQKNWEDKTVALKTKIQTSLMSRRGAVRRKLKPF